MRLKSATALKSEADGKRSPHQSEIGMDRAMTTPQFPWMNCFSLIVAPSLEFSERVPFRIAPAAVAGNNPR
jgi:hypothetical protein